MRIKLIFLSTAILLGAGCAATFEPRPLEEVNFLERSQTQSRGNIRVTAAVLSAGETEQVFGFALYKKGIQPVWLEIENNGTEPTWFLPVGLDPDYFPPLEVTYPYHRAFQDQYNQRIDKYFQEQAMGLYIPPGVTRSGFVFTNLDLGTKIFNVDLVGFDNRPEIFTFFVHVPGFIADHDRIDFEKLYAVKPRQNYNVDSFKEALKTVPCCITGKDSSEILVPLNLVLVADGDDLLRVLARSGWHATAAGSQSPMDQEKLTSGIPYGYRYRPVISLYYYGRRQDASFSDTRSTGFERKILRLWLSPLQVDGKPVWLGLVNRELSLSGGSFKNQKIDLDEDRAFFLQDLWYSQGIVKYSYMKAYGAATISQPNRLPGDLYYLTDGYRLILWIAEKSVSLDEVVALDWEIPPEK
jgi:hypothetical protein